MTILLKDMLHDFLGADDDWRITLLKQWPNIIGSLQTRVRIEKIEGDRLVLGVYEVHWMQELFLLSRVLLRSINGYLDQPRIAHVRFTLVEEKSYKLKAGKPEQKTNKLTPSALTLEQLTALQCIVDDQLKAMLISYLGRCTGKLYEP